MHPERSFLRSVVRLVGPVLAIALLAPAGFT